MSASDEQKTKDRHQLERLLVFDAQVAEAVAWIDYCEDPVVFTVELASEAAELIRYGHQTGREIRIWAFALLQRRDVLFQAGWSVPLLEILERYSFGGDHVRDAEWWRSTAVLFEPRTEAQPLSNASRLSSIRQAMDLGEGSEAAIADLRREGQEGVVRPMFHPEIADYARVIKNAADGYVPLDMLRDWALFVLGRREIDLGSRFQSQQIVETLSDCATILNVSDPATSLGASISELEWVKRSIE
jgi:hypothetical protein